MFLEFAKLIIPYRLEESDPVYLFEIVDSSVIRYLGEESDPIVLPDGSLKDVDLNGAEFILNFR